MPMRIPFTPPLPTAILFCALATTVSGSSTTTRAGELSLLTRGFTAWLELISIWMLSPSGTTFTRLSWLCSAELVAGFAAAAEPGMTAGLIAGAGAPGAGLLRAGFFGSGVPAASSALLESISCFCCSDFAMLRA